MNTDALFKELEPPPGGAERFARRLDEIGAERPSHRMRVLAAAAAAAAAVLTAIVLLRPGSDVPPVRAAGGPPAVDVLNAPELDRLLGRSAPPAEFVVTVNRETAAVTALETTNERVRIYLID